MIAKKAFGRTGHMSTRVLFGAAALGGVSQEEADQVLALLLRYGINHIDTAHSYGKAELLIGPWMPEHRDKFFLATKTEQRTYDGAWAELETSLELLKTDHIDLWQMHVLITEEGWQTAMGADGALKAFIQAREQGIVRFLGVTGHELIVPQMHLRSLERFDFDAVLLPYNYVLMQNSQYAADFETLLAACAARDVAVQTIKSLCRSPWPSNVTRNRSTWYQPLETQEAIDKAVHWILGDDRVFLNSVGDIHLLPQVLEAAANFQQRPSDAEMAALVEEQAMSPLFV
ncbi:MAG: aldo/keto reductase [Anaerolineae bacterium]|nr:aldo/keto reductase [Anaerolineae bacterium]